MYEYDDGENLGSRSDLDSEDLSETEAARHDADMDSFLLGRSATGNSMGA